ncbi:hypothetical protein [Methanofollis ethanolicus]|uniref:hypothetical protein n=1 Tax=Methanofollis ethanolicus TaxID=488124 RepID=UPI000830BC0B|nr:hypothetical protein [Methanofollis ethanolicus]
MLSIDFLAGFTIFLLALIVAAGMVPGMLAGLQSATIDDDGVAYRTSVILAEDPGWWFDEFTMTGNSRWEGETTAMDRVKRMGLAASRDTPNVLSMGKIDAFFNETSYQNDPDFYRKTVFFSDYPYSFNIGLNLTEAGSIPRTLGDPIPEGDHGYIRRAVMVKESKPVTIDFLDEAVKSNYIINDVATEKIFRVSLNFSELLARDPAYRIDPFSDRIEIRLDHIDETFNIAAGATSATLKDVRLYRGNTWVPPAIPDGKSQLKIDAIEISGPVANEKVTENISLVLEPGFFSGKASETSMMEVRFTFANTDIPPASWTYIDGTYGYNYTNIQIPNLKPAVLEVAVW